MTHTNFSEMHEDELASLMYERFAGRKWWHKAHKTDLYPLLAACWQHNALRVEIMLEISSWRKKERKEFVECIKTHLPNDDQTHGGFLLLRSKPMRFIDDASYPRIDVEDNTKRLAERWGAHPASGGGEIVPAVGGEPKDDGTTRVNDDVCGGRIGLSDEPAIGRPFEDEAGKFNSIYLDFINTYYVRDDEHQVPFSDIWKRFGRLAKKHPSKKVMGQFLLSLGLDKAKDRNGYPIYQGIRPKA